MRRLLFAVAVFALAGTLVSGYALRQHYAPAGSSFCNVTTTFSCDLVNQSTYSEIMGIPVAAIGVVGYVAMLVLAMIARGNARRAAWCIPWLRAGAIGGIVFSLILTGIELFIIGAICVLCVASQVLMFAIGGCVAMLPRSSRSPGPES
ncbi:vitamin K epoxide reductase family protein [Candidatus Uhrbacteria bacterium]|nr:vitamin K epoxide reductase family protein [Candidatus Uhrbacteria bacterium]